MTFIRRKPKKPKVSAPSRNKPAPTVVNATFGGSAGSVNFGDGARPTIALVNKATESLGVDFEALALALARYANEHIAPVWGTPCDLVTAEEIPSGAWAIVFTNTADVAGVLGYHDVTADGLPLSKVFVHTAKHYGEKPSVTAAHELAEMLVDPDIALAAQAPSGDFWAYEACDPVQDEEYEIDGVTVSNFIYPSFFEAFRVGRLGEKYDHLGTLSDPFSLRPGGYMPIFSVGQGSWTQIFGSAEREARWGDGEGRQRLARRRAAWARARSRGA